MVNIQIEDTETADGVLLKDKIKLLDGKAVRIGFFAGRHFNAGRDGKTRDVAFYAAINELGTPKIPSRPFLRMSADDLDGKDGDEIASYGSEYLQGSGSADDVFTRIGKLCVNLIKRTINTGNFVPNAPSTIRRKHSDKPLIDTGTMLRSVEYEIGGKEDN